MMLARTNRSSSAKIKPGSFFTSLRSQIVSLASAVIRCSRFSLRPANARSPLPRSYSSTRSHFPNICSARNSAMVPYPSSGDSPRRTRSLVFPCSRNTEGVPEKQSRSEEHTSELQSPYDLVCRLQLEKKKNKLLVLLILFNIMLIFFL